MPRKRSPIFHLPRLHKIRKPIIPKLFLFLKKSEELKLLRHYDYGEYQFSASRTHRKERGLCSFLYVYWCLGNLKAEAEASGEWQVEALTVPDGFIAEAEEYGGSTSGDEGESVDEKAERFIQSFYHQMRMQRQESL